MLVLKYALQFLNAVFLNADHKRFLHTHTKGLYRIPLARHLLILSLEFKPSHLIIQLNNCLEPFLNFYYYYYS